jgi:ubiquitin-protein ligase
MVEIFRTINKLLIQPNIRNAVSKEYLQLYEQNRSSYESRVYKHRDKHASKGLDELKRLYQLEDT